MVSGSMWRQDSWPFAIVTKRVEHRPVKILGAAGRGEVSPESGRRHLDGSEGCPACRLCGAPEQIEAAVLIKVFDLQRGDLGTPQPGLRTDREDRPVRRPSNVSSVGALSSFSASSLENASVVPCLRLMAGRNRASCLNAPSGSDAK